MSSFPSGLRRPIRRGSRPVGPTLDEVFAQLERSLDALRRANAGLRGATKLRIQTPNS